MLFQQIEGVGHEYACTVNKMANNHLVVGRAVIGQALEAQLTEKQLDVWQTKASLKFLQFTIHQ